MQMSPLSLWLAYLLKIQSSAWVYGGVRTLLVGSQLKRGSVKHVVPSFAHGELGAFHGQLNPLSSRSLVETCVMPVLMYGSESWCLNTSLLSKLESFQAEVGKRILRLPRFTANSVPLMPYNGHP